MNHRDAQPASDADPLPGADLHFRGRHMARTASLPRIALSAHAMPDDIDATLAAGMTGYWTKPLDSSGFAQSQAAIFGPPPSR